MPIVPRLTTTLAAIAWIAALPLAAAPVAVSPGGTAEFTLISSSCPGFDWSGIAEDQAVEIAIYRVNAQGDLEPVVSERLPAGARGWSPSVKHCLDAGSRYAWMVRGAAEGDIEGWSEARLFEVAGLPSDDEVRQALATLRRYRDGRADDATEGRDLPRGGSHAALAPSATLRGDTSAERPSLREQSQALSRHGGAKTIENPSPQAVTPPSSFALNLGGGDLNLDGGFLFHGDTPFIHNEGGSLGNTAVGLDALSSVTPGFIVGTLNSAFGLQALQNNTTGYANTASGTQALTSNTAGYNNAAHGVSALGDNTTGSFNTAVGNGALGGNTVGYHNAALGWGALVANVSGYLNTAVGSKALQTNSTGDRNTAVGYAALSSTSTNGDSTAVGYRALSSSIGAWNTAIGSGALLDNFNGHGNTAAGYFTLDSNTSGYLNTAVGIGAMGNNTTGHFNTAIGREAGKNWTTGHNNIAVGRGASGVAAETGTIRIGGAGLQTRTFIEGISNATGTFSSDVCISGDQLGLCSASSARFKREVRPLGDLHQALSALTPVSFRYKEEFAGIDDPMLHYGLIAEQVSEIFPSLVTRDEAGRPHTVRYDLLAPLLLGEIQRQDEELTDLRQLLAKRDRRYDALERRLDRLSKKKRFRR